jgi:hypothetical protein|tara:strand:+ start:2732 stop:2905 length:174 start_codon:yes stop_codon:yes gene_type:complete
MEKEIPEVVMKNKEYYTEELEKSSEEKTRSLEYQKYYTGGSIVLMFLVLLIMYFVLN